MRFTTTCCEDDGCVIVQIVMASPPDPPEPLPLPPQAARLVAAARAATAPASIRLELSLLCMLFPLLPKSESGEFAAQGAVDARQPEELAHALRPCVVDLALEGDGVEPVPGASVGQGQHRPGRGGAVPGSAVPHPRIPDEERPGRHQDQLRGL